MGKISDWYCACLRGSERLSINPFLLLIVKAIESARSRFRHDTPSYQTATQKMAISLHILTHFERGKRVNFYIASVGCAKQHCMAMEFSISKIVTL